VTALAVAPAYTEPQLDIDFTTDTPDLPGPTPAMIAEHGWEVFARCAAPDVDPDVMFPEPDDFEGQVKSIQVCGKCPLSIRAHCAAERAEEPYGTVAGQTEIEREEVRAKAKRKKNAARQSRRRAEARAAA